MIFAPKKMPYARGRHFFFDRGWTVRHRIPYSMYDVILLVMVAAYAIRCREHASAAHALHPIVDDVIIVVRAQLPKA
jgi:hypothetical protein